MKRVHVDYSKAEEFICHGDLLLFRGAGTIARLIATAGRSEYTHAAMVDKVPAAGAEWGSELRCLEVREFAGGRDVPLAGQVEKFPGAIDVFGINGRWARGDFDRAGAVATMRRFVGCQYGYWNLLKAAAVHCALWRLYVKPDCDDEELSREPPFCSEAVGTACRVGGGVDPVPDLADRTTEPADLRRSMLFEYRFTLQPDGEAPGADASGSGRAA